MPKIINDDDDTGVEKKFESTLLWVRNDVDVASQTQPTARSRIESCSVTRFGEISPLRQNFIVLAIC